MHSNRAPNDCAVAVASADLPSCQCRTDACSRSTVRKRSRVSQRHVTWGGKARKIWLRGLDLNQRPLGYEPNELPDCSTPHKHYSCLRLARQGVFAVRDICPDKSESPAISQDGWDVITERLIELARRQPELRFDPPYCVKQRASGRGWWSGLSRKDDFETRRSSRLKAVAFARRGVRRQSLSRSRGDKSSQFWNQPAAKLSV